MGKGCVMKLSGTEAIGGHEGCTEKDAPNCRPIFYTTTLFKLFYISAQNFWSLNFNTDLDLNFSRGAGCRFGFAVNFSHIRLRSILLYTMYFIYLNENFKPTTSIYNGKQKQENRSILSPTIPQRPLPQGVAFLHTRILD